MQAVLITPNGPDGSWWQGSDYPDYTRILPETGLQGRPVLLSLTCLYLAREFQIRTKYLDHSNTVHHT